MMIPDALTGAIKRWRLSSQDFARDLFGFEPDHWQRVAMEAFSAQDKTRLRIALKACAGPGKTAILAIFGLNFMLCYGDKNNHPKGAALSTTADNLRDNLWPELVKWYNADRTKILRYFFTITGESLYSNHHPETWFLSARSFSKKANPEEQGRSLSGLHSEYVIILIDESGDIPLAVLKTGEQAFSKCTVGRIVQAGNPTSHDGMLYEACNGIVANQWLPITITGDPDDPHRSPRIDAEWAREQIRIWGREDPWVMAYILGRFPASSINQLISPDEVEDAQRRIIKEEDYCLMQRRLGIDVARFGDDRQVIFPRQGLVAFKPLVRRGLDSFELAGTIEVCKANWNSEVEYVDDTGGWSVGVQDVLSARGKPLVPVNMAGKAQDPRYFNKRAEVHFRLAEWIKRGGVLPPGIELKQELVTPTYWLDKGKLRVEEKDQIKLRLKRSPDLADGLGLTFADPDVPASVEQVLKGRQDPSPLRTMHKERIRREHGDGNEMKTEYDPYKIW